MPRACPGHDGWVSWGVVKERLHTIFRFNFQTAAPSLRANGARIRAARWLAMTSNPDTRSRLAARCARVVDDSLAPRRAWGMPGARCTRSPCAM
jgi:hypothetical protein